MIKEWRVSSKETSAASTKLRYLHDVATRVFGKDTHFSPEDTVSIEGGFKHFDIYPGSSVTQKKLLMITDVLLSPGTDTFKVRSVSSKKDKTGVSVLRVTLD